MSKVCMVVATLFTARAFLRDQIAQLGRRHDLSIAANAEDAAPLADLPVRLIRVPIERKIAPAADVRALVTLYRLFRREQFDAVHSFTPKAGFLAMLAAWAARIPVRVHTFTGQVWATKTGLARLVLKTMDRLMTAAATHRIVDSASQRAFLRNEHVLAASEGDLLGKGSVSGVDVRRFRPDATARAEIRSALGIPLDAPMLVFVGRLSRDKGVLDLARAFSAIGSDAPDAYLLLVGPDEDGLGCDIHECAAASASRIRFIGMTDTPERYMAAGDIFCLPSYREGFGAVIIEAAAVGLPSIGSRIYGIVDAIEDGTTGVLVPAGDVTALGRAMLELARDPQRRQNMGQAARERALRDFSSETLTAALIAFYERVLPEARARASRTVATGL